MHARARVESVASVRQFRADLWQFAEDVRGALADAQSDVQRTLGWLEQEQGPWWVAQLRKRNDAVQEARRALDEKKLYRAADGGQPSTVEQEAALKLALRRRDEAERRIDAVKRWRRQLDRELAQYHAAVQRLTRDIETGIPNAVATLDRLVDALQRYLALQAPQTRTAPADADIDAADMGLPASLVLDEPDGAAADADAPAVNDEDSDAEART